MVLRLLQHRWAERIAIHRCYATVPRLRVPPSDVHQVFMNVLANACDAVPASGNIWIVTGADAAAVTVRVRDDGVGISGEHLARIFEPFFTTKPEGRRGRGLGLAISEGIVTSHGGTIEVTSEEGRGTEVSVVLPLPRIPTGRFGSTRDVATSSAGQ
jgi:signal transduction histidine kinase